MYLTAVGAQRDVRDRHLYRCSVVCLLQRTVSLVDHQLRRGHVSVRRTLHRTTSDALSPCQTLDFTVDLELGLLGEEILYRVSDVDAPVSSLRMFLRTF